MKRLFHKVIEFFDYYFYRASKLMVFDKRLEGKMYGGRCLVCVFVCFLTGIVIWPLLGLLTDHVTVLHLGYIMVAVIVLFFPGTRYSDKRLFKKLDEKYNNEPHSVLHGILLLLFVAAVITISILLLKYCVDVRLK